MVPNQASQEPHSVAGRSTPEEAYHCEPLTAHGSFREGAGDYAACVAGEQVGPTELAKFPVEGEKEMEEQEEHADLHGDMPVDEDMFTAWLQTRLPCASGVALYARCGPGAYCAPRNVALAHVASRVTCGRKREITP